MEIAQENPAPDLSVCTSVVPIGHIHRPITFVSTSVKRDARIEWPCTLGCGLNHPWNRDFGGGLCCRRSTSPSASFTCCYRVRFSGSCRLWCRFRLLLSSSRRMRGGSRGRAAFVALSRRRRDWARRLCGLRLSRQYQACDRRIVGGRRQYLCLALSCAAAGLSTGFCLVGALCGWRHRLAVPASPLAGRRSASAGLFMASRLSQRAVSLPPASPAVA